MEQVKCDFLASTSSKSVEELWSSFKFSINEDLRDFVPCKTIGGKKSFPWVTQEIKRLIRKRDSLFQKQKSSKRPNFRKRFVNFRHLVKAKIKHAYDYYLEDVLGLHDNPTDSSSSSEASESKLSTKKLFSFIKNCKQDTQGIGPSHNAQTGITCTISVDKATLLNKQFQSIFTPVSPLRLDQLCETTLKDGLTNGSIKDKLNVPGKFKPKIPDMPNISISLAGIHKLLLSP